MIGHRYNSAKPNPSASAKGQSAECQEQQLLLYFGIDGRNRGSSLEFPSQSEYTLAQVEFAGLYHQLSGLNNRNLLSHSSRGQKSEIRVSARLVPLEAVTEHLFHAFQLPEMLFQ